MRPATFTAVQLTSSTWHVADHDRTLLDGWAGMTHEQAVRAAERATALAAEVEVTTAEQRSDVAEVALERAVSDVVIDVAIERVVGA